MAFSRSHHCIISDGIMLSLMLGTLNFRIFVVDRYLSYKRDKSRFYCIYVKIESSSIAFAKHKIAQALSLILRFNILYAI